MSSPFITEDLVQAVGKYLGLEGTVVETDSGAYMLSTTNPLPCAKPGFSEMVRT